MTADIPLTAQDLLVWSLAIGFGLGFGGALGALAALDSERLLVRLLDRAVAAAGRLLARVRKGDAA